MSIEADFMGNLITGANALKINFICGSVSALASLYRPVLGIDN